MCHSQRWNTFCICVCASPPPAHSRVYVPALYVVNKIDQITLEELEVMDRLPHYVPVRPHWLLLLVLLLLSLVASCCFLLLLVVVVVLLQLHLPCFASIYTCKGSPFEGHV